MQNQEIDILKEAETVPSEPQISQSNYVALNRFPIASVALMGIAFLGSVIQLVGQLPKIIVAAGQGFSVIEPCVSLAASIVYFILFILGMCLYKKNGALICAGGAFILAIFNLIGGIWNVPMWIVIGLSFIIPKNKVIRIAKVVSIGLLFAISVAQIIASATYPQHLISANTINYGVLLKTIVNHLLNVFPVYLSLLLFSPYKKVKN